MPSVIQLPDKIPQTAFNLKRWEEMCADPELARIERRLETDRFGRIIMTPYPGYEHGGYQLDLGSLLKTLTVGGRVSTECPVSTRDGVRVADVAWVDADMLASLPPNTVCLPSAPSICVEVVSPSNSAAELAEKRMLYFDAGAKEVWQCDAGAMTFFAVGKDGEEQRYRSTLVAGFPTKISL